MVVRLKGGLSGLLLGLALLNGAIGRRINTTIYDTNTAHITYAPQGDFCVGWTNHIFWRTCDGWAKPWESEVYRSQGKLATLHRSLDHEQPTMTISFQGSAIWLYGPPRSQLSTIPVDHKICLHENHRVASDTVCYRVDVAEAYSVAEDYNAPVVIFAKGGLRNEEHRVVVSVGDPVGEVDKYRGVQFSHAVYTIERPTPWPTDEDSWRFREVVMHDTHPLLSYSPEEPVSSGFWPWSPDPSGWFAKTYTAEDGTQVSWHELQSQGESNQDEWGVDVTITAGVVTLFGIPRMHIAEIGSLSDVCVRINSGPCEFVDVRHAYLNVGQRHDPVLLWRNQALDSHQQTHISVRLVKTSDNKPRQFLFKAIHYLEQQEYSSPDPPVGRVENVAVAHDDQVIVYHPGRRCVNYIAWWCAQWFDPWTWKEAGPSGSVLTYRSTVSSYRIAEDPSITLDFQGSAVYVYGAPKSFMKEGFASQHICINDACHIVDVEQAYLNAPEAPIESTDTRSLQSLSAGNVTTLSPIHPELEPVLIWSMTGLDDQVQHSLRLALAGLPSKDSAEMSIAKVLYTKVTYEVGQPRPDTPIPQPDQTDEGPMYPPHAIEWAPRLPSPQPAPPDYPQHPLPPPRTDKRSALTYILWPVIGAIAFFFICIVLVISSSSTIHPERRPIRYGTPPSPYVPGPPAPPRPARSPPRPKVSPAQPKPPISRPNPPPAQSKSVPPPVRPAPQYPGSSFAGPSSSRPDPNDYTRKPIPKSDLGPSSSQCTPIPPKKSEAAKPPPKDQNNVGPCPGSNAAPPRPDYTDGVQKQPSTLGQRIPSQPIKVPASAQSLAVNTLPPPCGATGLILGHTPNHATSQGRSSSTLTSTPSRTSSSTRATAPPSQVQVGSTTHPPPHAVRPAPQVPPKPDSEASANLVRPSRATSRSDAAINRSERVQPTPVSVAPSAHPSPQAVLNRPIPHQTSHQASVTTPHAEPPSRPQEHAYTTTPALAEWAQSQGFRIDRLIDAAARNEHPPRNRPRRGQGQAQNAMLPFNPAAQDTVDQGNARWSAWKRTVEETGRVPPSSVRVNQNATPVDRWERGGRGREGGRVVVPTENDANMDPNGYQPRTGGGGRSGRGGAGGVNARRSRPDNRRSK